MERNNDVSSFMYYVEMKYSLKESIYIFGEDLGHHIFGKYLKATTPLKWYAELDRGCRDKLVERAIDCYDDRGKCLLPTPK
jgi:hypothetical protein